MFINPLHFSKRILFLSRVNGYSKKSFSALTKIDYEILMDLIDTKIRDQKLLKHYSKMITTNLALDEAFEKLDIQQLALENFIRNGTTPYVDDIQLHTITEWCSKNRQAYVISNQTITKDNGVLDLTENAKQIFGDVVEKAYIRKPIIWNEEVKKEFEQNIYANDSSMLLFNHALTVEFKNGKVVCFKTEAQGYIDVLND